MRLNNIQYLCGWSREPSRPFLYIRSLRSSKITQHIHHWALYMSTKFLTSPFADDKVCSSATCGKEFNQFCPTTDWIPRSNGTKLTKCRKYQPKGCVWLIPISKCINSFLTDNDTSSFYGQCRSRSDCTEHEVWSVIYNVHIFILDYHYFVSSSCNGSIFLANEKLRFIYSVGKELNILFFLTHYQTTKFQNGPNWNKLQATF